MPASPCGPSGPTRHGIDLALAVADSVVLSTRTDHCASSSAGNQTWNEYWREPSTNSSIQACWADWLNTSSSPPTRTSLAEDPAWMYSSPPFRPDAAYVNVAQ